jgi:CRISPR-associated protein Cas2
MRYLISYDIVDDPRRTRLAHLLENYGRRVQYSVFECELAEKRFLELRRQILKAIDPTVDSVRVYPLCGRCSTVLEVIGTGPIHLEDRVAVV